MNKKADEIIDIINTMRSNKGEDKITTDNLPDEIYEECSSSDI